MRILLGLNEIAGNLQALKEGFDRIGVECDLVLVDEYQFGVKQELLAKNWNITLARYFIVQYRKFKKNAFMKIPLSICSFMARLLLLLRCIYTYDVFVMHAYSRFLNYKELPVLKFFGKKIIYQVVGSDFRPPYLDGSYFNKSLTEIFHLTLMTKKRVNILEKYASCIISYNPVSHFQKRTFVDYRYIGIAVKEYDKDIDADNIPLCYQKKKKYKIVHAPTNKVAKGSAKIIAVIEELRKRYDIEFVLLYGMDNREILYHIATSDFVIDQLYSEGCMARFSCEAAFFGKPSIVTGYDVSYLYHDMEDRELIPPLMLGKPENIKELIIKMIEDDDYRISLGKRARNFVTNIWKPEVVAEKIKKIAEGTIDEKWLFNPFENRFGGYYGKEIETMKKDLSEYIQSYGDDKLFLEHNLELKRKVLSLLK